MFNTGPIRPFNGQYNGLRIHFDKIRICFARNPLGTKVFQFAYNGKDLVPRLEGELDLRSIIEDKVSITSLLKKLL